MKKVSLFVSRELQVCMDSDQEFRTSNLVRNALALVAFVTETVMTGVRPRVTFPACIDGNNYLDSSWKDDGYLADVLKIANRTEIHMHSNTASGASITLRVEFYRPGKDLAPTLTLLGNVEDFAVRGLRFQSYRPGKMVKQG